MSSFPSVKILIVDDRPENLLALHAAFKNSGYELFEAHSGKEALDLAKKHNFACILLDVQMPVLDGYETAKALRNIPRSEHTPIIFVTAIHRSDAYEELGYVAGAVDYLFKPINTKILQAKVAVFVEMFLQSEEIKKKNQLLEDAIARKKENEQLRIALKARDEFLLMASHELQTPITPLYLQMQTFIQIFESDKANTIDKATLLRMLHTSQGQLERLSRLIKELVDVSRISAKKLTLTKSEMNLCELVNKVMGDFETEIKKSGSTVTLDCDPEIMGNWDSFRIEQVLVNLLTNALKYGSGKPIELKIIKQDKSAVVSVKDRGIGIDTENHLRIFQRFERAVSGDSYSGLGLGLYISSEIVASHGGKIWVESNSDEGVTFYVELPI